MKLTSKPIAPQRLGRQQPHGVSTRATLPAMFRPILTTRQKLTAAMEQAERDEAALRENWFQQTRHLSIGEAIKTDAYLTLRYAHGRADGLREAYEMVYGGDGS